MFHVEAARVDQLVELDGQDVRVAQNEGEDDGHCNPDQIKCLRKSCCTRMRQNTERVGCVIMSSGSRNLGSVSFFLTLLCDVLLMLSLTHRGQWWSSPASS